MSNSDSLRGNNGFIYVMDTCFVKLTFLNLFGWISVFKGPVTLIISRIDYNDGMISVWMWREAAEA